MNVAYLFIFFSISTAQLNVQPSKLRKVFVITRHGDRSPTKNYPNLHQWKILGELTGEGMSQMYHLGSNLRQKYIVGYNYTFLPREYHLFERGHLLVRATDKDRTLMSANSLLLGLYPPGTGPYRAKGEVFTEEYGLPHNIQVIPIHTEAAKNDRLLYAYKSCPELKKLQKAIKSSEEWILKELQTLSFLEKLSNVLGNEVKLDDMSAVYHGIKAEKIHAKSDLSLLGLTESDYQQIIDLKDWTLHRKFWTREMGRLGAGILLKNIIDSFWETANKITLHQQDTEKTTDPQIDPIFVYYSGHDGTLLSLFSAMGLQGNFDIPHYSSFVLFELHEVNNAFEVIVQYNNKSLLPDCPVNGCSLSKFTELNKPGLLSEDEYDDACGTNKKSNPDCAGLEGGGEGGGSGGGDGGTITGGSCTFERILLVGVIILLLFINTIRKSKQKPH